MRIDPPEDVLRPAGSEGGGYGIHSDAFRKPEGVSIRWISCGSNAYPAGTGMGGTMRGRSAFIVGTALCCFFIVSGCAKAPATPGPTPASSAEAREATLDAGVSTALSNAASGLSTALSNVVSGGTGETALSSFIAAGGKVTCLLQEGRAACWGQNQKGQVGDGTFEDRHAPAAVTVVDGTITALAVGYTHACALRSGGDIVCWGSGVSDASASGVLTGYQAVSAGSSHTCGLTNGGEVRCWGRNALGGLGDGTTENRPEPVDAVGLTGGATAVSAGADFSCAVHRGGVRCWGANDTGQLGNGTYAGGLIPDDVLGMDSGMSGIAAGVFHACAWNTEGGVWCWGENLSGQLGDGTMYNSPVPVRVEGLTGGARVVVAGGSHTCALRIAGGVVCWGNNDHGQLGDGTTAARNKPGDVAGLTAGVVSIAAGVSHTCALLESGSVRCWGLNDHGQLGNGTNADSPVPVEVVGGAA
jgi:alpha-tubulin suppressor-like RCC1 family protein